MIRVGIGGWVFAPWRGEFYPKGLPHARELEHASRNLTSIEINGTFYRTQKPESFRKWADETPDDFVFSVKGPQFATNRRVLAEAGESIERFFASGVLELKAKLGPIFWQIKPFKKFEAEDVAAFLALLPHAGRRHGRSAMRSRCGDESFAVAEFVELLRQHSVAPVLVDSDKHAVDRGRDGRFRLSAACSAPSRSGRDRLCAGRARCLGQTGRAWADGGAPERPADDRRAGARPSRSVMSSST